MSVVEFKIMMGKTPLMIALFGGTLLFVGCQAAPPRGSAMQPASLGAVVDDANRRQEDNAEQAKFIVYVHEFELNKPRKESVKVWAVDPATGVNRPRQIYSRYQRGFRLNDYGREHIVMIADAIMHGAPHVVVVERSQTSKRADTVYEYPVHFNHHLDEQRRQTVVAALQSLGVEHAEQLVVIASAFPTGLSAEDALQAFSVTGSANRNSGAGARSLGASGGF